MWETSGLVRVVPRCLSLLCTDALTSVAFHTDGRIGRFAHHTHGGRTSCATLGHERGTCLSFVREKKKVHEYAQKIHESDAVIRVGCAVFCPLLELGWLLPIFQNSQKNSDESSH